MSTAVAVNDVSKSFRIYQEKFTSLKQKALHLGRVPYTVFPALSDISFEVEQGSSVGLLGHNGSGKSTLLKCIAGILAPTHGEVLIRGRVAAMLELGAGFSPDLSGRANIYLNASLLGLSRKEIDRQYDAIVEFSELGAFIGTQVKFYSSGMYMRLGFAVAVHMDPDVLLVDEVLAVGDGNFQLKCMKRIRDFQKEGRTIIFVSHSPEVVRAVCDTAFVLDHGKLIGGGSTTEAITILQQLQIAGSSLMYDPADGPRPKEVTALHETPVRFGDIHVNGHPPDRPPALATGEPADITFELSGSRVVSTDVSVSFRIKSAEGIPLFVVDSGRMESEPVIVRGDMEATFRIAELPLVAGTYSIDATLYSLGDGTLLDFTQLDNAFTIVNPKKGLSGFVSSDISLVVEESRKQYGA